MIRIPFTKAHGAEGDFVLSGGDGVRERASEEPEEDEAEEQR